METEKKPTKIVPVGQHVLVEIDRTEKTKPGDLIRGHVVVDLYSLNFALAAGDVIFLSKYYIFPGDESKPSSKDVVLVSLDDVVAREAQETSPAVSTTHAVPPAPVENGPIHFNATTLSQE